MKSLSKILVSVLATSVAGMAMAGSSPQAMDIITAMALQDQGQQAMVSPNVPARATLAGCDIGTPDLIVHDDNEGENGYGFGTIVTHGELVEKFTPVNYPADFPSVCMSFITNDGTTSLPVTIVVYDDDGAGGGPGTLLGSVAVTAHPVALAGLPFTPTFETFDLSPLPLYIDSGSVYIGAYWDGSAGAAFLGADETPATPQATGYVRYAAGDPWLTMDAANDYAEYRAMMIRPLEAAPTPEPPTVMLGFTPDLIGSGDPTTLTITFVNATQPTAATLSADFTDVLPIGMTVASTPNASTDCANATLAVSGGDSSVTLPMGAEIPAHGVCTLSVDVVAADGTYTDTLAAGDLQTSNGANVAGDSAEVRFGYVFPEPYCAFSAVDAVEPITYVEFGATSQSSDVASTLAHEDFTGLFGDPAPALTSVSAGATLQFAVEGDTGGSYTDVIVAYADWNQDGDFDDAGEKSDEGTLVNSDGMDSQQAVFNFVVPVTAALGQTRLRVVKSYSAFGPACGVGFGQAEEYIVDVTPPAPMLAVSFAPDTVMTDQVSTATVELINPSANPATLTAALVDSFPAGLTLIASSAATTCEFSLVNVVPASVTAGQNLTLPAGFVIPANDSCTVTVDVSSAVAGTYVNTLAAGALQTDQGSSSSPASASLLVEARPDKIFADGFELPGEQTLAAPVDVPADFSGMYFDFEAGCADASAGCPSNDWNPWGSSSLSYYWPSAGQAMCVSTDGTHCDDLAPGATIDASSSFISSGDPSAAVAGTPGTYYMGVQFMNSVTGTVNYGYVKFTTPGTGGAWMTVEEIWYNPDGGSITIQ